MVFHGMIVLITICMQGRLNGSALGAAGHASKQQAAEKVKEDSSVVDV